MVYQQQMTLATHGYGEMQDLTDKVNRIVGESGITAGIVHVFNVGSTAAVGTIEFEPGLQRDLPELLSKLIPPSQDYLRP